MTTDDLTAAVARLLADANEEPAHTPWSRDVRTVLSALEAAQADARRYRALHEAISDNYYCHKCDVAPASQIKNALAAIDAARAKVNTTEGEK